MSNQVSPMEMTMQMVKAPNRSCNVLTDLKYFFFNVPEIKTLVDLSNPESRLHIRQNILQRIGIGVENYSMLNIHKIGVEAPASYLFEEIMKWNGDSSCWPNHIANVDIQDEKLEKIKVYLFRSYKWPFGTKTKEFGFRLFDLNILKTQKTPVRQDVDNARYLIYNCSGGYPIGIFTMYVRSSIAGVDKQGMSQLFILTGFNFFGNRTLTRIRLIRKIWEMVHNRVTTNVANRFKQLCEWRFHKFMSE